MSPQPLRRQIGQLLIGSFAGSVLPVEVRALAREFDLGGLTLFNKHNNIEAPDQVAELAFDVRKLGTELPAWVAIDQEGGRVARLKAPFTEWPAMATLGRSDDDALAARFAGALARELAAVGISLDYAPVLDVHTNPRNSVIGDRALADRAEVVARLGRVIIQELQSAGIAACGKHFPGHGDTSADSHFDLPVVEHPLERLKAVEFLPFQAAIDADVAFMMTAHVLVVAVDDQRPATLSSRIVGGLLRDGLGFRGVILSDDLDMNAVAGSYGMGDAAVAAIAAGCDGVLVCNGDVATQVEMLEALVYAVEDGTLPLKRVDAALDRQRRAKERFLQPHAGRPSQSPLAESWRPPRARELQILLGCEAHRAIAEEMSQFA